MSYNTIAYQVDATKIQSAWGSKDKTLLARISSEYKEDIEDQLEWFDIDRDVYNNHLSDLVEGKLKCNDHNYLYGYAYELLCREYGEFIACDEFLPSLEDVSENNHKAFIPIPGNDDWPEFYSVHFDELENGRRVFLNNKEDYANSKEYQHSVNLIFDTASRNKKSLQFFCY